MSLDGTSRKDAPSALGKHVFELRRRCKAITDLQGGSTYLEEDLRVFEKYAEEEHLYLRDIPRELSRPPDDEGNEHQVWYRPESDRYLKVTWPGFFGMLVVYRINEETKASPIAYLDRWLQHCEIFGDVVEFIGAINTPDGLRLVIEQKAVKGSPATDLQTRQFFQESGWKEFRIAGEVAYFDPARDIAVSDTHSGNIIISEKGVFLPIDLRVQKLTGALPDIVRNLCG